MNQSKRRINENYDKKIKKVQKSRHINYIENLSNEVLYEIFDYLDACDLYKAFSNLNKRFQDILSSSYIRPKTSLTCHSKLTLEKSYQNLIFPNRHQIISFSLWDTLHTDFLVQSMTLDASFRRLESVVLYHLTSDNLIPLLLKLSSLPRLNFLTLTVDDKNLNDLSNVYRLIFNLPALKYNKLSLPTAAPRISVRNINNKFSTIEYLIFDHSCNFNDLAYVFSYTPRVCRVVCKNLIQSYQSIQKIPISLPYLTHISIDSYRLRFDEFEILIQKISSKLQVLRISTSDNVSYLDPDRWERLISQHIPHLSKFYFEYSELLDEKFQVTQNHQLINRYTSSFWLEQGWIFALEMTVNFAFETTAIYSIHPYREKWYHLNEYIKNDKHVNEYNNLNHLQGTELTVFEPSFTDYNELLIDKKTSFFNLVQITKLDIVFKATFVGMLLDLLRHLPNLDSLRIWSLSLIKPRRLHAEEERIIELVSANNEIKNVNIQQMSELTQVQFLINLCPSMKYFEIGCPNNFDLNSLVQFIIMENRKQIPSLQVLCLCIQTANDKMIDELRNMIKRKIQHRQYTIKRIVNKIYIQRI